MSVNLPMWKAPDYNCSYVIMKKMRKKQNCFILINLKMDGFDLIIGDKLMVLAIFLFFFIITYRWLSAILV